MPTKLAALLMVLVVFPASAQGVDQKMQSGGRNITPFPSQRTAVPTHPSSNPFVNPIGQGVPPAVSTNPYINNRRTSVPLGSPGQ